MSSYPAIPRKADLQADLDSFPAELLGHNTVLLDGAEVDKVFAYDMDEGFLLAYEVDPEGNIFIRDGEDEAAWHRLEGKVEVILK